MLKLTVVVFIALSAVTSKVQARESGKSAAEDSQEEIIGDVSFLNPNIAQYHARPATREPASLKRSSDPYLGTSETAQLKKDRSSWYKERSRKKSIKMEFYE